MTTSITVKTHDWPVKVHITDDWDGETTVLGHKLTNSTYATQQWIVMPNSEQTFHITNTRSIMFEELPKPESQE